MVFCKECRHFSGWSWLPSSHPHFRPSKREDCGHSDCFKTKITVTPLERTEHTARVHTYEDFNKNNDCIRFDRRVKVDSANVSSSPTEYSRRVSALSRLFGKKYKGGD